MLTADLVPVRRRGDKLRIRPLEEAERDRLTAAARAFLAVVAEHTGRSQAELVKRWDEIEVETMDFKLLKGLRKLIEDRCTFDDSSGLEAPALRRGIFTAAARYRRSLDDAESFDARQVLLEAAPEYADREGPREPWLFSDLLEHRTLTKYVPIDASTLVTSYEWAQKQAVLLRATRVSVVLLSIEVGGLRHLFHKLKFHRLLYEIHRREAGGYGIEIDGPFSLFHAVTKYGLGLALLLPTLDECGPWTLDARIRWDKSQRLFDFHLEGGASAAVDGGTRLPVDIESLVTRIEQKPRGWTVAVAHAILDMPGIGLSIPDLIFRHPESDDPYYLEVMGFWSRDAVWRRVELVQAGLAHRILFAVSSRLRVSEKVLDGELPGQLYVYKGTMMASEILNRLDAMRQTK